MAKILFAWELGGGAGHLAPFFPIAKTLVERGHTLILVVRDLGRATNLFESLNVTILPAPIKVGQTAQNIQSPATYPHVLYNVGFADRHTLSGILHAWRAIFDLTEPDLVIVDHAPGALLALRGRETACVSVGNGFLNPPHVYPMPTLGACSEPAQSTARSEEDQLAVIINSVLKSHNCRSIDTVGGIFDRPQAEFLTTFAELDHYSSRIQGNYCGSIIYESPSAEMPQWPRGKGPRIFAYLSPSRGLAHLFDWIAGQEFPALIVSSGLNVDALRRIAKPNLKFVEHPIPMKAVSKECDMAILNANHGTTCAMLLAGKPIAQVPHHLEQAVTAQRTVQLGAGVRADRNDGLSILWQVSELLHNPAYSEAAAAFAGRYRDFDSGVAVANLCDEMESTMRE